MSRASSAQAPVEVPPQVPSQILLFPQIGQTKKPARDRQWKDLSNEDSAAVRGTSVVLCGTYRKDPEGLRRTFDELKDLGFSILSPTNVNIESEEHGFVYMQGESTRSPEQLENNHLDAIQRADFVWFFAPEGYVGPTGAMEVGFARANGIPVYTNSSLEDATIKGFVQMVDSPMAVRESFETFKVLPPPPAVKSFQHYYRRAAHQRGYSNENPKDCLLLMVEEVGELARALRKRAHLVRHGSEITNQEALELADVFIYVVHMANILKLDLSKVVQQKELINIQKLIDAR
jgi:NTP pyrophosphatase (non-canonical NTP hydrolase)